MRFSVVLGTRPEIVKMSPIVRELQRRGLDFDLVHTGQHYSFEMDRVFFRDLERATKLALRFLFYVSPIIYGLSDLPSGLHFWATFNPLAGIFSLYRSAFFPEQLDWFAVGMAAIISAIIFCVGVLVFARTERAVLKEI